MQRPPNGAVAALLGFFIGPMAALYVARPWWMLGYCMIATIVWFLTNYVTSDVQVLFGVSLAVFVAAHCGYLAGQYPEEKRRPLYSRGYVILAIAAAFVAFVVALRSFCFEPFRIPSPSMLPTLPFKSYVVASKWGYGNYGTYGFKLMKKPRTRSLTRGDIIVFEHAHSPLHTDKLTYVSRLIGLPGDQVSYLAGRLEVNGNIIATTVVGEYFDPQSGTQATELKENLFGVSYSILQDVNPITMQPSELNFAHSENCSLRPDGVSCLVPKGHLFVLGDHRSNSNDSRFWGFLPEQDVIGKVVKVFKPLI